MKGWDDIAYNFSVSDNGSIFVGRGWDYQGVLHINTDIFFKKITQINLNNNVHFGDKRCA